MTKAHVLSSEHYNKPICIQALVNGKSVSPYCVPRKIQIVCNNSEPFCSVCICAKQKELSVVAKDESILKFIDISSSKIHRVIQHAFDIKCEYFSYELLEMQNIERIFISHMHNATISSNVTVCYFVGHNIDINTAYSLKGYSTVDPTNQTATHVFTDAKKLSLDIDTFDINNEYTALKPFRVTGSVEQIFEHLNKLYASYASSITKIYSRFDLHLAIDLAFKSVLAFTFDNEYVHNGWADIMILGDSTCGKGKVAEKLKHYFKVGDVISADNCSYVGLVGGIQKYDKYQVIAWGKIPINDRGLVIIDEASEIKPDMWSKLSRMRRSGTVEITKIQKQTTTSRTRLIYIANPFNTVINNYTYGIQAINSIIHTPEDIARFDYVLIVSHNDVSTDTINARHKDTPLLYTQKQENALIMWIWSRAPNEIVFSDSSVQLIYELSKKLAATYSYVIPLIQKEDVRLKLAKIAIGFAGRLFSNVQKGKCIYVDTIHVECAYYFLNYIYKKDTCGYYTMSKYNKSITNVSAGAFDKVENYIASFVRIKYDLCKCLLNNNYLNVNDISEHLNLSKELAREIISTLLQYSCITKHNQYYIKTPVFTEWLKKNISIFKT